MGRYIFSLKQFGVIYMVIFFVTVRVNLLSLFVFQFFGILIAAALCVVASLAAPYGGYGGYSGYGGHSGGIGNNYVGYGGYEGHGGHGSYGGHGPHGGIGNFYGWSLKTAQSCMCECDEWPNHKHDGRWITPFCF